jgi:hypothetical protein
LRPNSNQEKHHKKKETVFQKVSIVFFVRQNCPDRSFFQITFFQNSSVVPSNDLFIEKSNSFELKFSYFFLLNVFLQKISKNGI